MGLCDLRAMATVMNHPDTDKVHSSKPSSFLGSSLDFLGCFFWNLLYFPSCRMVNIPIHGKLGTTTPRLRTMFVNAGLISQSCQGFLGGYSYPFYTAHVALSIYMCVYICVYIRVYIDTTSWNGPQKLRFWFKPTKSNLSPILVAKNPGGKVSSPSTHPPSPSLGKVNSKIACHSDGNKTENSIVLMKETFWEP